MLCEAPFHGKAHTLRECRDALIATLRTTRADLARHVAIGTAWRERCDRLKKERDEAKAEVGRLQRICKATNPCPSCGTLNLIRRLDAPELPV